MLFLSGSSDNIDLLFLKIKKEKHLYLSNLWQLPVSKKSFADSLCFLVLFQLDVGSLIFYLIEVEFMQGM